MNPSIAPPAGRPASVPPPVAAATPGCKSTLRENCVSILTSGRVQVPHIEAGDSAWPVSTAAAHGCAQEVRPPFTGRWRARVYDGLTLLKWKKGTLMS